MKKLYFPLRKYMVRQKTMQGIFNTLKFKRLNRKKFSRKTVLLSKNV